MPQIDFHPLTRADGSATYQDQLFSILAGVNGPVEVQRRDELPDQAAIEVNVRPLSGTGGPRERWLEETIHSVLRSIVLTHLYPRTLVQVTLQIVKEPKEKLRRDITDIWSLPSLINAAFVALIDSGLPLRTTAAATLVMCTSEAEIISHPVSAQLRTVRGVHAVVYDARGALLLSETAGATSSQQLRAVHTHAADACQGAFEKDSDEIMAETDIVAGAWLRQALQENVRDATARRVQAEAQDAYTLRSQGDPNAGL